MRAYRELFAMVEDICRDWMGAEALEARGGRAVAFQILALIEAANLSTWANPGADLDRPRDAERIMAMLSHGLGGPTP